MDNRHLINVDIESFKDRIQRLTEFIREAEEDIFNYKKISADLYDGKLEVKIALVDRARKALHQDLEYLRRLSASKEDIDPELSNLVRIIMSFGKDMRYELKEWLSGVIKRRTSGKIENTTFEEE